MQKYTERNEPWFTRGSITFLEKILNKHNTVLEYGCGRSTIWYAQRVKHLISIEHNKAWFDNIDKYLRSGKIKNVDLRHIDINNGYIEAIDEMGLFDLISVDGRRRSDCIEHAYTHVRDEGYLLLDNADRKRYEQAMKNYLSEWKRFDFHNTKWLTSIFQKVG